jgi:hypothetical protein
MSVPAGKESPNRSDTPYNHDASSHVADLDLGWLQKSAAMNGTMGVGACLACREVSFRVRQRGTLECSPKESHHVLQ